MKGFNIMVWAEEPKMIDISHVEITSETGLLPLTAGFMDYRFVFHRHEGMWNVTELSTGFAIAKGRTVTMVMGLFQTRTFSEKAIEIFNERIAKAKVSIIKDGHTFPINDVENVCDLITHYKYKMQHEIK